MDIIRKKLVGLMLETVILTVAIIAVYETGIVMEGTFSEEDSAEFLVTTVMELVTICFIPLALRMLKFDAVRAYVQRKDINGYFHVAYCRMTMLQLPLLLNVILYYLFMNVAFGYMAIILFISLAFITPTKARCEAEYENCIGNV